MIVGSYYGFLLHAGHMRTGGYGHHSTYKDLREAFLGQSASVCLYPFNVSLLAFRRRREEKEKI